MYSVGDYVVKANNGVCRIVDMVHPDFAVKKDRLYYLMVPVGDESARVYVPVDGDSSEMRAVITEEEAWDVIGRIKDIEAAWISNDRLREQFFKDAIRSLKPESLIGIIKNMYIRRMERLEQGKKSTAVDDRYFKIAENTLYSELAFAIGRNKEEMFELIKDSIEGGSGTYGEKGQN